MDTKSEPKTDSLTVKSILALLSEERMIELFDVLEMTIPKRPHGIREKIDELICRYFDLVWIASKDPIEFAGKDFYERVAQKYPEELLKLQDPGDGDWQHGFNSGMLACARLLYAYALPYKYGELVDRGPNSYSPPSERPPEDSMVNPMLTMNTTPFVFPPLSIVQEPAHSQVSVPEGFVLRSMVFPGNPVPINVFIPTESAHIPESVRNMPYAGPLIPDTGSATDDEEDSTDEVPVVHDVVLNDAEHPILPVIERNLRIFEYPTDGSLNRIPKDEYSSLEEDLSSDECMGVSMGDEETFYSRDFQIKMAEREFPLLDT